jgi:hypothetical protein
MDDQQINPNDEDPATSDAPKVDAAQKISLTDTAASVSDSLSITVEHPQSEEKG